MNQPSNVALFDAVANCVRSRDVGCARMVLSSSSRVIQVLLGFEPRLLRRQKATVVRIAEDENHGVSS